MIRHIGDIAILPIRFVTLLLWISLALGPLGHAQNSVTAATSGAPSSLIGLDDSALRITQQRIHAKDPAVMPALAALQHRADAALRAPLRSVMDKSQMPASGSKHDYISMGPYWWPNPATANGLPYIQRDGQVNPESKGEALDSVAMGRMCDDSLDLALAYRFTGDARYANKAAEVLRTWFLKPATRMNPNLRFAQAIPGIVEGRGIGLIDTRSLWKVMDAMMLIGPALSSAEVQNMRQWFADYAHWFDTSKLGRDESLEKNNHGMFYDMQMAGLWLFLGETERAKEIVFRVQTNRFANQFTTDGLLPLELKRTRPYHYTVFTLEAATRLAHYGQIIAANQDPKTPWSASDARCNAAYPQAQCPLDLWGTVIEGKSLRRALDAIAGVVIDPASWKYASALEKEPILAPALPVLLRAQRSTPAGTYSSALLKLQSLSPDNVAWLLWPLP